ncbi:hypothetical protein [Croceivirga thetidis]|uniref:Uncharacterized protein n=1 Tax=Croceivirga thetidis TaxID=2721623 RepID=A0ABX1GPD7_9FLAO|nr:hypothetical protein [Croceivirga thetidis]NKI31801.1 hypothetical protein [Croceivirga thetidis]
MKYIFALLTVLICSVSYAQERHRFELGTQAGYEYNYFKSPDELIVNGTAINENDLISSSAYQDIFFDYDYRYKWKANRVRISVSPFVRLFQENMGDSYWSFDADIKYDHKISKKTKLLGALTFVRMNREGLDGAQDVLVNPLGYTNYGASGGVELKPIPQNKTTFEGFYNFKNFDSYGVRDLEFNELGLRLASKQEFRPNRYEHAFGFTAYYKKRLYKTFNTEESPASGERDWDYFKANLFYELPIGGYLELEPQLTYYGRYDRLEGQSGFNQYGPGLRLKFDNDKTKINASIKYQIRDYTSILAPGTEDALTYSYTDFSLNFEHQLPLKGLFFTGTVYSRFRETNTIDLTARSFRGYTNQYAGLGVLWKL